MKCDRWNHCKPGWAATALLAVILDASSAQAQHAPPPPEKGPSTLGEMSEAEQAAAAPKRAEPEPAPPPDPEAAAFSCQLGQKRNAAGQCVETEVDRWAGGAEPPPSLTGRHWHDGVMFRVSLGAGLAQSSFNLPGVGDYDLDGVSVLGTVDVGATVVEGLIVHGRVALAEGLSPEFDHRGLAGDLTGEGTLGLWHLGAAGTYYLMPLNAYATLSLGIAAASFQANQGALDTDLGWGLSADLGKEFWVDDDWGLGFGGRFMFGQVSFQRYTADGSVMAFGVFASATYQ